MLKMERKKGVILFLSVFVIVIIIGLFTSFYNPTLMLNENTRDNKLNYTASLVTSQKFAKSADGIIINYITEANTVVLRFPANEPKPIGRVLFLHATKRNKDRVFDLKTDPSKQMFIPLIDFDRGVWQVLVKWQVEAAIYSKEVNIDVKPNDLARPMH